MVVRYLFYLTRNVSMVQFFKLTWKWWKICINGWFFTAQHPLLDPDPNIYRIWIRIQAAIWLRIHPDPDPKHWLEVPVGTLIAGHRYICIMKVYEFVQLKSPPSFFTAWSWCISAKSFSVRLLECSFISLTCQTTAMGILWSQAIAN